MIKNEASYHDPKIDEIREAIEHRATWFYLMVKAAKEKGLEMDDFARKAVMECGIFHGKNMYPDTDDLEEFASVFCSDSVVKTFEQTVDITDDELKIVFHYCPLVEAWQKLTDDEDLINHMCDIAMDGDRGIVSTYDEFEFELGDTIAKGCPTCQLTIRKKRNN